MLLATVGLLGGCASSSAPQAASEAVPVTAEAPKPACPIVTKSRFAWPADYPQDLPQPPGSTFTGTSKTRDGLTLTKFTSAQSLQQSVAFVVTELKRAGFELGRGDSEGTEADAPFAKGDVRGVMKMLSTGPCSTSWLVAVTRQPRPGATSPLLPTPYHSTSPSPLPSG